jgi:hypothetical protein
MKHDVTQQMIMLGTVLKMTWLLSIMKKAIVPYFVTIPTPDTAADTPNIG